MGNGNGSNTGTVQKMKVNPFYHLVDPDWVLKAPLYSCRASVPGQTLLVGTTNRKDYCADVQDCVVDSRDGNTCQAWGYCTREKNTWQFNSNSCPSQYSSCRTLTRTSDKTDFNLLTNTLDTGNCNIGNAGCLWYSRTNLSTTGAYQWVDQNRIYLNRTADKCEPENEGCSQFLSLSGIKNNQAIEDIYQQVQSHAPADPTQAGDSYSNYASVSKVYLNGKRVTCSYDEAGCQQFTPANGDPAVNGVAANSDRCPAECVGYSAFVQQATLVEAQKPTPAQVAAGQLTINFIPSTAVSCTAQDVGCDQFTNLDQSQAGGESLEYYSYIRQCQKPASDCAHYYTWQGTEDTGYQLRDFNLKAVNLNSTGSPKTTDGSVDCTDRNSPDCKKFYDINGNTYYRDYKKTISCSDSCFPYRITNSTQLDCVGDGTPAHPGSNGNWDNNQCVYTAIPSQGVKCSAAANGCREFRGNTGENIAKLINTNFDSGTSEGFIGGTQSAESISAPGRSLKVDSQAYIDVSGLVQQNKTYVLDFWLKTPALGSNTIKAVLGHDPAAADHANNLQLGTKTITNERDWNSYSFGPLLINRPINADERLIISVTSSSYIDNVVLKEVQGLVYAVKNSWNTPLSCETDPPLPGGTGPASALGCKKYTSNTGQTTYLKSFSRLCAPEKVGCQAMVDTQNSESPYAQTYNAGDKSQIIVPKDKVVYVVNDPAKACKPEKKGCSALGQPTIGASGGASSWDTVFKIDDPEKYATILCKDENLFCEEFQTKDSTVYYKNPNEKICEFRSVPNTSPVQYAWFKKGDTVPNPAECGKNIVNLINAT
ncbi:hypothetical protein HY224_00315, partial [Candidatus Uhrbacteria bacterium]|nr:hypothetical protein [Candidatus Uhrbacteria bacterium]